MGNSAEKAGRGDRKDRKSISVERKKEKEDRAEKTFPKFETMHPNQNEKPASLSEGEKKGLSEMNSKSSKQLLQKYRQNIKEKEIKYRKQMDLIKQFSPEVRRGKADDD